AQVPKALEAVLMRALELAPADRFATAEEFADALEAARAGTAGAQQREPARRYRKTWIALTAAAVIVGGIALILAADGRHVPWMSSTPALDTTQVVVFRFEAPSTSIGTAAQDALTRAISRWRGVRLADPLQLSEVLRGS